MKSQRLMETAAALVVQDKGVLAMDESTPTRIRRFAKLGIPLTKQSRRAYRELLAARISEAKQVPYHRAICNQATGRGEYKTTMELTYAGIEKAGIR